LSIVKKNFCHFGQFLTQIFLKPAKIGFNIKKLLLNFLNYMANKPKIAIIGAGLAGLTAALRLDQKNYQIEVYEARKRVGGRVFTAFMKNAKDNYSSIELGGQNIADGNNTKSRL
jgi:NADPH-dependent 2,4-dienoyl-CoA reductase/sulfur reductase-like enzyme